MKDRVLIIMGSKSDWDKVIPMHDILVDFNIPYDLRIASAHRTPNLLKNILDQAEVDDTKVIIAAAGGAAHLAGVIASHTLLPVIALPISSKLLGIDSLLSMVQMPSGIPVATVGIDMAKNAAILATQILAVGNEILWNKLRDYRNQLSCNTITADDINNLHFDGK